LHRRVTSATQRVRISGQLIDVATGAHLWADRFDSALSDIFDLQDQVTASVVGAILPKLEQAEIERAGRKPTENLDAYDYYLRGMASLHRGTREAVEEALRLFYGAIERDRDFASALGMTAWCYALRKWNGWIADPAQEITECAGLARRAVTLGKDDSVALSTGGFALAFCLGEVHDGAAFINRALALNPNLATAWHFGGWVSVWLGEPQTAIDRVERAMRLSPLDPFAYLAQGSVALAHFAAGHYEEALSWAQRSIRERPNFLPSIRIFAASCAMAGRQEDAEKAIARLRELNPTFRLSDVKDLYRASHPEDLARYEAALRKAGLPE
jgi:tetratricopeptide (TPR) repeat protein